jgi:tRNA pseudouridine55 synthase
VIKKFIGEIKQIPPMYSAIKVSGNSLYKLARKGIEVERMPRKVIINSIELLKFKSPFLVLKVSCSKGTYIRSLCNDIGNALGVGAHIVELVRTRIGDFTIENSAKINELPHKTESLSSIDTALKHLPEVRLEGDNLKRARHGNPVILNLLKDDVEGFIRLKDLDGKVFGIGKVLKDSIKIERLFNI